MNVGLTLNGIALTLSFLGQLPVLFYLAASLEAAASIDLPLPESTTEIVLGASLYSVLVLLIEATIPVFLLMKIAAGKIWARDLYVSLFVITNVVLLALTGYIPFRALFAWRPVEAFLAIVTSLILPIIILIFSFSVLFSRLSRDWFEGSKS